MSFWPKRKRVFSSKTRVKPVLKNLFWFRVILSQKNLKLGGDFFLSFETFRLSNYLDNFVKIRFLSSWPFGKILTEPVHYRMTMDTLREGLKKEHNFIHILWIGVTTPLIHVGRFYNNIIKFKYYPHRLTPPPLTPLSTFWIFIIFFFSTPPWPWYIFIFFIVNIFHTFCLVLLSAHVERFSFYRRHYF